MTPRATTAVSLGLLLATFVAGTLVGTRLRRQTPDRGDVPPVPLEMGPVIEQLDLDASQTPRVNAVLERWSNETGTIMSEVGNRLADIADSLDSQLRELLTADQLQRYDSLLAVQRGRIRMRRPRPNN